MMEQTVREVIREGAFGGTYLRDIYSRVNKNPRVNIKLS